MRPAPPMDRTTVDVRVVTPDGVQARDPADLPALLRGPDLVWIDVPQWDEAAAAALVEPLGLHAGAVRECAGGNAEDFLEELFRARHGLLAARAMSAPAREVYGRMHTRVVFGAERLAVIAAVTLPVTAISSVMGMNVIVNDETHWGWLGVLLAGMLVMSIALLIWARRQGWW
jgi:Mg2+ and Co2+ transporter CorA